MSSPNVSKIVTTNLTITDPSNSILILSKGDVGLCDDAGDLKGVHPPSCKIAASRFMDTQKYNTVVFFDAAIYVYIIYIYNVI